MTQYFNQLGSIDVNRNLKDNKGDSSEMHPEHSQLEKR